MYCIIMMTFFFLQIGLTLLGIILVVGYVNPYLMIPTFIIAVIFYKLRQFYLTTSRSVKRLEGISKLIEVEVDCFVIRYKKKKELNINDETPIIQTKIVSLNFLIV